MIEFKHVLSSNKKAGLGALIVKADLTQLRRTLNLD